MIEKEIRKPDQFGRDYGREVITVHHIIHKTLEQTTNTPPTDSHVLAIPLLKSGILAEQTAHND